MHHLFSPKWIISLHLIAILFLSLFISLFFTAPLFAAPIFNSQNVLSTMQTGEPANHTISFFTPTGLTAGQSITLNFPSEFDLKDLVITDIDMFIDDQPITLASAAATTTWGVAIDDTLNVITFVSDTGTIAPNDKVEFLIGTNASAGENQIINPSVAGNYDIIVAGTFADSGAITVIITSNSQVSINAEVENVITFSISETSLSFGSTSPIAARWANSTTGSASFATAHTINISTNASLGYSVTLFGDTLTSGSNSIAPIGATPATSNPGSEQFGIFASINDDPSNNATVAAMFGTTNNYAFVPNDINLIFSADSPSAETIYDLSYILNVSSLTAAGSYSTNVGYIATANF